ncbi:SsgA family sporulation/cell division regulator [Streptomyces sp. SID5789]|uniref:SsgA family sporulation/cell division regulator n=1 Tax=Streptomyces sp. SID5789 TaxID=2690310 RepID=UPI001367F92C|nr:SsgA family sporulation/cell division regulator [Streptomyces sp. SID5789]MZE70479.1 SsgA family sporulation/cell division regulator [Streptomyces sp. SID5789]
MSHHPSAGQGPTPAPESGVSRWCEGSALLEGLVTVPVTVAFRYDAADPYAVRMAVHTEEAPPVEWVFARELLIEGLSRPAGLADVQVWPVPRRRRHLEAGRGAVNIRVSSQHGTTVLTVQATSLHAFLDRTLGTVAAGAEDTGPQIDAALASWLVLKGPDDGAA